MTGRKYVKNVFSPLLGFFSLSFVAHCIKLPYHFTMRKCFHPVKERPNPHGFIKGWVVWPEIPDLDMREPQLWGLCFGLAFICLVVMVWGRETKTHFSCLPQLCLQVTERSSWCHSQLPISPPLGQERAAGLSSAALGLAVWRSEGAFDSPWLSLTETGQETFSLSVTSPLGNIFFPFLPVDAALLSVQQHIS